MQCKPEFIRYSGASIVLALVVGSTQIVYSADSGYAPKGIHMGNFYLFPVVEIGVGYDDNVFRLPDSTDGTTTLVDVAGPDAVVRQKGSDTATVARASVAANSDWSRHALNGIASIDLGEFDTFSSENFGNYALGIDGQLDIKRGSSASGKAGYAKRNESRSSVDSREGNSSDNTFLIYGTEPTQYHMTYVGVGYDYNPARLGFSFGLDYQTLEYEDVTNVFGQNVDNSDRNRSRPDAVVRIGYEVMPQRNIYVEGNVHSVDYDQPLDNSGIERSSTGYKVTTGMSFDLSNLLLGDVFVGYLEQNYDSPTQADISSNLIGLGLQWFPSRLTSVGLHLDRNVEESTEATVSGYLSTTAGVEVNHELKRNIILTASADYTNNDFQQNVEGQKENEDITGYGLKGRYLISRLWYASLEYRYENRQSDIALQEYTNNRGLFTLGANW